MLREFGQRKLQPLLMRIANSDGMRNVAHRLMPLVTVVDCNKCPALEYCLSACVGFKRLYMEQHR